MTPKIVLTIAGSDPCGGAGIQADIKTIHSLGAYALSVITSVTAQSTMGVSDVYNIPAHFVAKEIDVILKDIAPQVIKLGMLGNEDIALAVFKSLYAYINSSAIKVKPFIVIDPIILSTSGKELLSAKGIEVLKQKLFPISTLITPNLPEAEYILGHKIINTAQAAEELSTLYGCATLIKGGHSVGNKSVDYLYYKGEVFTYNTYKIDTKNLHGTGCTFSSAIATYMAMGNPLNTAVAMAKDYINKAIIEAKNTNIGKGSGPLQHFFKV